MNGYQAWLNSERRKEEDPTHTGRFYAKQSDGLYGEWEVLDFQTGRPVVEYAWRTQEEAEEAAQRHNADPETLPSWVPRFLFHV